MKKRLQPARPRTILVMVFLVVFGVFLWRFANSSKAAWYDSNWGYRVKLTIDETYVTADQTDFPIYVDLSALPANFHTNVNQTDARDIRVTTSDGLTELPREVVFYTAASDVGELHFKYTGTLSGSADTDVYIYYGNAAASDYAGTDTYGAENVWDSNYVGVWHMNESSSTRYDSTDKSNDLSVSGTVGNSTSGKLGGAGSYTDAGNLYRTDANLSTDFPSKDGQTSTNYSVTFWMNATSFGYDDWLGKNNGTGGWGFYDESTDNRMASYYRSGVTNTTESPISSITTGTWYHVMYTHDTGADADTIYINNSSTQDTSRTGDPASSTASFMVGGTDSWPDQVGGLIDEVRVSKSARSSTWTATEYNNHSDPATFFATIGSAEQESDSFGGESLSFLFDEGNGTTVRDSSGGGYTGTLTGATTPAWQSEDLCVSGKCLYYQGTTSYTSISPTFSGLKSVSFWVKPKTNSETLIDFDGGTHYLSASSGTITATGFSTPTIYVNGVASAPLVANVWQHVEVTTGTAFNATAITIGKRSTNFLNGFVDEFRLYDYVRSASQVKQDFVSRGSSSGVTARFGPDNSNLSSGLVGYWKMDESSWTNNCSTDTVMDSSGNSNNGDACIASTGPVGGAVGKFGRAGNFDGSDDYVQVANHTSLQLQNVTLSAWIIAESAPTTDGFVILDKRGPGGTGGYNLRLDNTSFPLKLTLVAKDGSGINETGDTDETTVSSSNSIAQNTSYFVTGTIDTEKNIMRLYIDGVLVGTQSTLREISNNPNTDPFRIAEVSGYGISVPSAYNFDGTIDEARVYNRALSPAEVASLYNWAPGPVGYWKMDENTGTTAYDSSGNGFNFTSLTGSWTAGKYGASQVATSGKVVGSNDVGNYLDNVGKFTISFWARIDTHAIDWSTNLASKNVSSTERILIQMGTVANDGRLYFDVSSSVSQGSGYADSLYTKGEWFHITEVYDGTLSGNSNKLKAYVNGVQKTLSFSGTVPDLTANIGADFYAVRDQEKTAIDDMRVYNYARTPSQIVEDMNGGHPAPGSPVGSAVSYWKFDEGALNTCPVATDDFCDSGINANGLAFSTTVGGFSNSGKFGKAYDGGSNLRATRSDDADFDFTAGTDDFTLSAWFNRGGAISNLEYILDKHGTNDGYTLYMDSDGDVVCGIGDGAAAFPEETVGGSLSKNYDDTNWHQAVCVKSGTSSLRLFVDGVEVASDTSLAVTDDMSNSGKLIIGDTNETDGSDEWLGDIDEIKIFRTALTGDQVKVLYNQSSAVTLGALSTDASNNPSNASVNEYCPPGQGSTCVPPVGHWKLDDNAGTSARDSSANGFTGTWSGTLGSPWTKGKLGSAGMFDGSDDRITAGNITSQLNFATNPAPSMTVEAWFYKPTATGGGDLGGVQLSSNGQPRLLYRTNGTIAFQLVPGENYAQSSVTAGQWIHAVGVYDNPNNELRLYINGALVDSVTPTSNDISGASPSMQIGNGGSYYLGYIDDVRVYGYIRTSAQIAWDYNRGAPVGRWKMDECTGTTINDASLLGSGRAGGKNGTWSGSGATNTSAGTCTVVDTATAWYNGRTGRLNSSLDFDGADDVVSIANASAIDLNEGLVNGFTFSSWIYPNSAGESNSGRIWQKLADGDTASMTKCFLLSPSGGRVGVGCGVELSTSDSTNQVVSAIPTGQWSHIAFSWTNDADDETTVWINGTPYTSSGAFSGDPVAESATLFVGGNGSTTNSRAFDGLIDDFRVYNYELTAQQIKSAMNDGAVKMGQ